MTEQLSLHFTLKGGALWFLFLSNRNSSIFAGKVTHVLILCSISW